jgi:hypothetical protein
MGVFVIKTVPSFFCLSEKSFIFSGTTFNKEKYVFFPTVSCRIVPSLYRSYVGFCHDGVGHLMAAHPGEVSLECKKNLAWKKWPRACWHLRLCVADPACARLKRQGRPDRGKYQLGFCFRYAI